MMAYPGEPLPLSPEEQERRRIELNAILARHRMVFEVARLAAEERLNPIKEYLS